VIRAQAVLELEQIAVTPGAEVETTIASLYSGDEVLMVARLR
jgi:hypothetical protein